MISPARRKTGIGLFVCLKHSSNRTCLDARMCSVDVHAVAVLSQISSKLTISCILEQSFNCYVHVLSVKYATSDGRTEAAMSSTGNKITSFESKRFSGLNSHDSEMIILRRLLCPSAQTACAGTCCDRSVQSCLSLRLSLLRDILWPLSSC